MEVDYDHDGKKLTIRDNANGMEMEELERAVILDKPPPVITGRSEYGMGLQTAACWFGTTLRIRTKRLGSKRELSVRLHVPDLKAKHTHKLEIQERPAKAQSHFTEIEISGILKPIHGRTYRRVHDQLGSMYREDFRKKEIEILWNGRPVSFVEPPILEEKHDDGTVITWKKPIEFAIPWEAGGKKLKVAGWVGIRNPGSTQDAGFALLRRGRVVVGGPGAGYRPTEIFGAPNDYRYQRLVGELNMDEWPVTQAKDQFEWSGDLEERFIEELGQLSKDYGDHALLVRTREKKVTLEEMEMASESTRQIFEDRRFGEGLRNEIELPTPPKTLVQERKDVEKLREVSGGPVVYRMPVGEENWVFRLHWQDQLSDANWMSVSYPQDNQIDIFLNMAHPFFAEYMGNKGFLEILQRFVISLALAEKMARRTARNGLVSPEDFRVYMNRVLRRASSLEAEGGG